MAELHFSLIAGADESRTAKFTALPRLRRADNLRVAEQGVLRKRFGTEAYADGTVDSGQSTPVGPVRLARHDGRGGTQTLVFAEDSLWTVSADGDRLEELDTLPRSTLKGVTPLGHYIAQDVVAAGSAQTDLFRVWAWVASPSASALYLHIMVTDLVTGAASASTLVPLASFDTEVGNLKLIRMVDSVVVFWGESNGAIKYLEITSATLGPLTTTQGTELVSAADAAAQGDQWFDVSAHGAGYVVVFRVSATSVIVRRYNQSHAQQATATHTVVSSSLACLAIVGDVDGGMCMLRGCDDNTTTLRLHWLDANCTARSTDTYSSTQIEESTTNVVSIAACKHSGTDTAVAWAMTLQDSSSVYMTRIATSSEGGGDVTLTNRQVDTHLASKPWVYRGDVYTLCRFWRSQANSYYAIVRHSVDGVSLASIALPMLEARVRDARAPSPTATLYQPACGVAFDGSTAHVAVIALDRFSDPSSNIDPTGDTAVDQDLATATGTQVVDVLGVDGFSFAHNDLERWQTVQVGEYTAISGGMLTVFDGRRVIEVGFPSFPEATYVDSASGGSMDAGTYHYAVLWEYVDYLGNRSQSAPKISQSEVVAGTTVSQVAVGGIYCAPHTMRQWARPGDDDRPMVVAIYTSDNGGSTLQRLDGSVAKFKENNTASHEPLADYSDTYNRDTIDIIGRELLYTSQFGAGELANMMPPPVAGVAAHEGRIVFIDAEDPTSLGYTKIMGNGRGPAWNGALRMQFDEPLTAVFAQDGNLIASSRTKLYTVTGVGLDNLGRTGGYNAPQLLSAHSGVVNWRSVVSTPVGTFFQSQRGIEQLPRGGGSAQFIGEGIRDTFATYQTITAALHVPQRSEVWFSCVDRFASEWDPTTVAACVAWFDPTDSDNMTITAGKVSAWNNKVSGVAASQATAASRPRIEVVNGRKWMRAEGSQTSSGVSTPPSDARWLQSTEAALSAMFRCSATNLDYYVAFILWPMSTGGLVGVVWSSGDPTSGEMSVQFSQNNVGVAWTHATVGPGADTYHSSAEGERITPRLFEIVRDNATTEIFINGVSVGTNAADGNQTAFSAFNFFKACPTYTYVSADCRIGDWVAYSTIPSAADRAYIRAGLAARAGLGEKLGIPTYAAETGRVLVWDYRVGTWFVRNYQDQPIYSMALEDGDAGEGGSGRVVLGIYNDADAITLWREDAGWDDADAGHVATVLETGDIRLKGSQGGAMQAEALGLQRIRALNIYGTVRGGPELMCSESVDGGQTYESKDAVALTDSENWTYRYQTKRLRAQQHRLRLTEEAGTTNDCEGVAYAMLSLDCNPASGLARTLPTDRG